MWEVRTSPENLKKTRRLNEATMSVCADLVSLLFRLVVPTISLEGYGVLFPTVSLRESSARGKR